MSTYKKSVVFFFFENTGSHCIVQGDFKLVILLPWPPKFWNYRHIYTPCLAVAFPYANKCRKTILVTID
jgi:hypothetical protein